MEDSLSPLLPPTSEAVIERTHRPNGSVAIKSSTSTPRADGFRDVKVEYFILPPSSNAVASARYCIASPGSSPPPLPDYLTRVEYRVVPPGLEVVPPEGHDAVDDEDDDPSSTAYFSLPAPGNRRVHFEEASFAGSHARSRNVRRKNTIAISIMGVLSIVLLVIIGVALTQDYSSHLPHKTSRDNSYDAGGNKSRNETSADDIDHVNRTNVIGDE